MEIITPHQLNKLKELKQLEYDLIRKRSKENLWFLINKVLFNTKVKGVDITEAEYHYQEDLHQPLCDEVTIKAPPGCRKLFLLPRKHRKSYIVNVSLAVYLILNDPNIRILIVSAVDSNARRFLGIIKRIFQYNEGIKKYFPEYHVPSDRKFGTTYEFVHPLRTLHHLGDPTVRATYLGSPMASGRCDVLIADDPIEKRHVTTTEQADKAIANFNDLIPIVDDTPQYNKIFVIGCLTGDTKITLSDGTKKSIVDMNVGDEVLSSDIDGKVVKRKVEAFIPQGEHEVLELQTTAHKVKATPNHPFLKLNNDNLEWKRLDELNEGDFIVSLKSSFDGPNDYKWMNKEFCWLFGFLMGDGWCNYKDKKGYVCFAKGIDEELNNKVIRLFEEWFPKSKVYETKFGYYRIDNLNAAKGLKELGLSGGAKGKRLQDWIFRLPIKNRRYLLRGFCDADGCKDKKCKDSYRVEISNKGLLEDLKHLANLCGVRTGKTIYRKRTSQPPNSPEELISENWSSSFNFATVHIKEQDNINIDHKNLRVEKIVSIKECGAEEVYDLTIEGTPSFISNGLICHNTRWSFNDLYAALLGENRGDDVEENIIDTRTYSSIVRHCLESKDGKPDFDNGIPIFSKRYTKQSLHQVLEEYRKDPKRGEEDFWKQMMNVCISPTAKKFYEEWFDTWVPILPSNIVWSGILIDSATKDEQVVLTGDYTACLCVHFDAYGHLYLTDGLNRNDLKANELMDELVSMSQRNNGVCNIVKEKVGEEMFFGMVRNAFVDKRLPIVTYPISVRGQGKKVIRIIEALQQPFMGRKIHFVGKKGESGFPKKIWQILRDQLVHIGQWSHDDLADCLSLAFHKDIRVDTKSKSSVEWQTPYNARLKQKSSLRSNPSSWSTRMPNVIKEDGTLRDDPFTTQIGEVAPIKLN